ncbi:SAM-dependent methyltransferase [Haloarcula sp. S1CR25-12]|uniref:SAM-dependent methyltransferase n=1 Tax=Haloarcula saliterrae TaxID=2950534 RepID=A0ABU2FGT3_9EURY|nr:N-6 DNA methylase [Haloarcula sp. S1CR25-12]MDS0260915.1 SAM-dependent methyltransferase [Haloarcula sp. S1CR25-12]
MNELQQFDQWGRDSQLYADFVDNAQRLLAEDREFQTARDEWQAFFTTSHGDIFGSLPLDNPVDDLFIDSLYYDFVVDQLIEFAEQSFEFTLVNQEPRVNTETLSFSFQALHERVLATDTLTDTFATALSKDDLRNADTEFLRSLYETVFPREIRLALGEYYTPRGVAELAVDAMEVADMASASFLDPGCGSGVFTAVCIDRKIAAMEATHEPDEILSSVTASVFGMDLNPVAVKSTKLNYLLTLLPVIEEADAETVEIPVFLTDALKLTRDEPMTVDGTAFEPSVTHLVGNPPWITWGRLSEDVKSQWRETYVDQLDLLPHDGAVSRLGHGNDDIAVPYIWVCVHHYLQENGQASFVLKRDIMKGPAGKLLRTLTVADRPLDVSHIHDFNKLQPFGDQVGANAAVYTLSADTEPTFPIDTTSWTADSAVTDFATTGAIRETLRARETTIVPLDEDDSTSAWIRADAERGALGDCDQEIRHGVKDDAQDVFSIDREQLDTLEPDHVYPYIKSKHVVKYGLFGHELRLVPIRKANEDNEDELRSNSPKTYQYLADRREQLEDRASSWLEQGPFYNVFGLGDYTWADYKVVWCRLGFKPNFAVVSTVEDDDLGEKMVVPGDHYMFIGTDCEEEAHFLCALLNSAIYQRSLKDIASEGKASLSKSVVSQLELPAWHETEESLRLAELSMEAHDIVPAYTDTSKRSYNKTTIEELEPVQAEIDRTVEEMLSAGTLFPEVGQRTLSTF